MTTLLSTLRSTLRFATASLLAATLSFAVHAQQTVNTKAAPPEFVSVVANNALEAVKQDKSAQTGDRAAISVLVDQYVMPYVNFEKTTRLAAGRHWRNATPEQRNALVDAFKNTLIRTYSGALSKVDDKTSITILPFRGDANAADVVVRSTLTQPSTAPVSVDYRMENTPDGWKIYDINVENIWLIQNYRNQFADVITRDGFDGLISALNQQNR